FVRSYVRKRGISCYARQYCVLKEGVFEMDVTSGSKEIKFVKELSLMAAICISIQSGMPALSAPLKTATTPKTASTIKIAQTVANETPDAFVNRFLAVYAAAKGPDDVEPLLSQ